MGEPREACFKDDDPYLLWTTTTTSTSNPVEDFFILPVSGVDCPGIEFSSSSYNQIDSTLLLHCETIYSEETNDSSINMFASFSAGGDINSSVKKFGNASYFGPIDILPFSYSTGLPSEELDLSNTNFTIEFWTYPMYQYAAYPSILGTSFWNSNHSISIRFGCSTTGKLNAFSVVSGYDALNGGDGNILVSESYPISEWYHVAYVRAGNMHKLFINGELVDTYTQTNRSWPNLTNDNQNLRINYSWDDYNGTYSGYLDELRITKAAIYYSNFTLPSEPFLPIVIISDYWKYPEITITEKNTFICNSEVYDPNPCVLEADKYIRVADIDVSLDRCSRYRIVLTDIPE